MTVHRPAGRAHFSKDVLEAHLRNRREILEQRMERQFHFTLVRSRLDYGLPQDAPQALVLLVGQWATTQDLIDDFIANTIRARPSALPAPEPSLMQAGH